MVFVRRLVLACLKFNILFRARHVPGVKNILADSLSRLQVSKFKQPSSGGCALITNSHTNRSPSSKLADITTTLVKSSFQPSSVPTYRRPWKLYNQFSAAVFKSALVHLPISSSVLSLFIAYMFEHHCAASTANTYVSAHGYCHRLAGATDPTKVFWIIEMLKGHGCNLNGRTE